MLKEILDQHRQVVGVFSERETAGQALDRLVLSGFPIAQAFLVGPSWTISERHDQTALTLCWSFLLLILEELLAP